MSTIKQETHRPGALKQSNKQHKTGRHRSKSSINNDFKSKQSIIGKSSKRFEKNLRKNARRNQLLQHRKKKREQVLAQKRNLGGFFSAPILICVIPLQNDIDIKDIVSVVTNMDETANVATSSNGIIHISIPRLKQRFSIIVPPIDDVFATLDAAKVATTILFVTSVASQGNDNKQGQIIDDWGKEIITSCLAQGLSSTIIAVHNIQTLHIKKRQEYKQSIQRTISKWLPAEKVFELDTTADCLNMLRHAGLQKQRSLFYKDIRPYLLAEEVYFECDEDSLDFGTLMVSGYLRGATPLCVNSLIHISDFGNFQMSCIKTLRDPYLIEHEQKRHLSDSKMKWKNETEILTADPEKQESLESEYIPDPMDAEQTWPTKEELAEAANNRKRKIVKVVPKGTSEYQAAWIPDEDGESLSICSENEDLEDNMDVEEAKSEAASSEDMEDDEQYETITISEALDEERYDQDIDMNEEKQAMEKFKEAKLDVQFPDEVDTPQDSLAKIRFQKYRGLESFRTSPWDPKENLPIDYSRIIEFSDYDRRRKRIYKECKDVEGVMPGCYIQVCIARVSKETFKAFAIIENKPLIVVGLLPYEHKMSLLNVVLKHSNNYTHSIKSKERLIFQCGFRRFTTCPIFSQHTNGTKHKYERYFHPETTVVASMYAPVTFSPCPILCYVESKSGKLELIATGSVLSCDPNRIVLKRVILSGHPYKVNKKSVVIRFMFFHREDIEWFKPVQMRTKYGRRGHIKEPLGTHGHMKCIFNGQLKSQDTVLMNLYKRVFPKWTYELMNQ
ncbi:Pre-rRNA-processing protein TSR1 like protein [Atta colombica]|uniref:Pre-rRNA-processing protein TSR1 homolog n=1 Tax=Atta colombica TaxID=520822 RepID=A0A195BD14_9HYME|nr:PREDICTED: pre-rRNA-processing protein TSR1 homolog [Atta colombica]KYM82080.1 Pre-rRNA-processing protein TSR1 like protein [Atta colombica]